MHYSMLSSACSGAPPPALFRELTVDRHATEQWPLACEAHASSADHARSAAQGREKIHLIELFLGFGVNILVSDVDTVW